jgi:hypothetical protein
VHLLDGFLIFIFLNKLLMVKNNQNYFKLKCAYIYKNVNIKNLSGHYTGNILFYKIIVVVAFAQN